MSPRTVPPNLAIVLHISKAQSMTLHSSDPVIVGNAMNLFSLYSTITVRLCCYVVSINKHA